MTLSIFNLVIWIIAGILTLCDEQVPKISYALLWVVLILHLIGNCLGV
jgi:hypothetical protein